MITAADDFSAFWTKMKASGAIILSTGVLDHLIWMIQSPQFDCIIQIKWFRVFYVFGVKSHSTASDESIKCIDE